MEETILPSRLLVLIFFSSFILGCFFYCLASPVACCFGQPVVAGEVAGYYPIG
jgi:hypothetical protein